MHMLCHEEICQKHGKHIKFPYFKPESCIRVRNECSKYKRIKHLGNEAKQSLGK